MRKLRDICTLVLVSFLIFIALTGCAGINGDGKEGTEVRPSDTQAVKTADDASLYEEPMTITYASWDIGRYMADAATDAVFQAIAGRFNITVKPINLTYDDYTQKIQMWAASGQLPDIFSIDAVGTQFYRNLLQQNKIKPLPTDLGKYPNLRRYLDTPDIRGLMEDGRYYCIPRKTYASIDYNAVDRLVEYRWDLAQKAGITKEPETWDEFKAMLEAIVRKDPEGKKIAGFTCINIKQIGGFFWLFSNPAATSDGSGTDYKWIREDGRFIPAVFSKNALPSLQNMRDMYDRDLIDQDMALTKGDQGYGKFVDGRVAALLHGGGYTTTKIILDRWKKAYPDRSYADCIKPLKPLKSSDGGAYHATFKTYWSESYFNVTNDDAKMDRTMGLYDFLVSDEGHDILRYGIKDVDYIKNAKEYQVLLDPKMSVADKYKAMPVFKEMAEWDQSFPYDNPDAPVLDPAIRQTAVDYMKYIKENTSIPPFDIRLTYLSTPAKDKFTITDYLDMVRVLLSDEPVSQVWGDILEGYRSKGLDKVISEVNAKAKELDINPE